jgi:hypothetical protein
MRFTPAIPRRAARPASGFGSRGPAREAEEGGQELKGLSPFQQEKTPFLPRSTTSSSFITTSPPASTATFSIS